MVAGEGDLGGAGEVEVVGLEAVDLVGVRVEEARRRPSRRVLTSVGVIIGVKPASTAWAIARLSSAELEPGADAGEEVEPRAADLGAALHVDGAEELAELEVVARLEALRGEVAGGADGLAGR